MPLQRYPFDLAEQPAEMGIGIVPDNRIAPTIDLVPGQLANAAAGIGISQPMQQAPMAMQAPEAPQQPLQMPTRPMRQPMGDGDRMAYALEAFGAGMRGQPSLAERERVEQRKEKSQRLLEIKAEVDVYESAVKAVKGLSGPQRKTITDDLASQFDADRPGLAKSIRGLASKDDGQLAVVQKYASNSPTLKRSLETGGLEAALKIMDSPTVTAELDVSAMPNIVRKANGLRLGFKDILPPEMVKRFGDALDGSEYIEAVDWMKANLPETSPFRKLIPDEAETLIAQRNSKAFHTQAGMMSPEDQAAVKLDAEKKANTEKKPLVEHNYSIGGDMVQPHISHDNGDTWVPIPGSKPSHKFARQVAPVFVGGDQSQWSNITSDGRGGWTGLNKKTGRMEAVPSEEGTQGRLLADRQGFTNVRDDGKGGFIGLNKKTNKIEQIPADEGVKSADAGALTEDAIRTFAIEAKRDRSVLANVGRGVQGAKDLRAILNQMAENEYQNNGKGPGIAESRTIFRADSTSLNKMVQSYDAITAFEANTANQGAVLKTLVDKVDTTGVPVVERWIRAGRKSIAGDPDVSEFNAQLQIYATEAARILQNPNLTGVLTDSARHEVQEFLPKNATGPQIKRVVDRLTKDFEIRRKSLETQMDTIKGRLSGTIPERRAETTTAPGLIPQGWTVKQR